MGASLSLQSIRIVGAPAFILHQKIQKMVKCTWVVPDKVQRAVKWLCVHGPGVKVLVLLGVLFDVCLFARRLVSHLLQMLLHFAHVILLRSQLISLSPHHINHSATSKSSVYITDLKPVAIARVYQLTSGTP